MRERILQAYDNTRTVFLPREEEAAQLAANYSEAALRLALDMQRAFDAAAQVTAQATAEAAA